MAPAHLISNHTQYFIEAMAPAHLIPNHTQCFIEAGTGHLVLVFFKHHTSQVNQSVWVIWVTLLELSSAALRVEKEGMIKVLKTDMRRAQ
jgi:hypothetical protein